MTTYLVDDGTNEYAVTIVSDGGDTAVVEVDGERLELSWTALADGRAAITAGGQLRRFRGFSKLDGLWLSEGPRQRPFAVVDERESWLGDGSGDAGNDGGKIKASMPGRVVKIDVEEGQHVQAGDIVVVLEAMKMENDVKTTVAGVVAEIGVTAGEAVETGQLMLRIETPS